MEDQHPEANFDTGSNGEDAELYLLKWNSHQNHFANKFSELLDEDEISFADVTLACEGNFLQAHRLVLSVCSPFFKNLFKINSAEKGPATIVLANVRYTDLENILHFIYRGQVNVRKEDLNKFLETGEQLQIDGLVGQGQTKQNTFKRRFSDGGQVLNKSYHHSQQSQSTYVNKSGTAVRSSAAAGQYKTISTDRTGSTSRLSSTASQNNHSHENPPKKSRISPTAAVTRNSQESVTNPSPRRLSTSTHHNNTSSPSHALGDPSSCIDEEHGTSEGNNIKILSVASVNPGYETQNNDVIEILDYEDDDRPENEMDDGGEEGVFYTYPSSYSLPQSLNQQSRLPDQTYRNTLQARYPSIIDGVHFELISADEKRVAAQCKLCPGDKVIRGSGLTSSNFISHLRAFHKRELEEWREKRKTETRRRQD